LKRGKVEECPVTPLPESCQSDERRGGTSDYRTEFDSCLFTKGGGKEDREKVRGSPWLAIPTGKNKNRERPDMKSERQGKNYLISFTD